MMDGWINGDLCMCHTYTYKHTHKHTGIHMHLYIMHVYICTMPCMDTELDIYSHIHYMHKCTGTKCMCLTL